MKEKLHVPTIDERQPMMFMQDSLPKDVHHIVVMAEHNVENLVDALPDKKVGRIREHYCSRAIHHIIPCGENIALALPISWNLSDNPDRSRSDAISELSVLASWMQQNLGVSCVFVDKDPVNAPFTADTTIIRFPYYVTPEHAQHLTYGPNPEHSTKLKDKAEFHKMLQGPEIQSILRAWSKEENIHGNVLLPFEIAQGKRQVLSRINDRLTHIRYMYDDAAFQLRQNGNKSKSNIMLSYEEGVVARLTKGDGGYGTIFFKKRNDGQYEMQNNKQSHIFPTKEQAYAALDKAIRGEEYIITRWVDELESPSVGVYMQSGKVKALPPTIQFMNNGSCVGGGSSNADGVEFKEHIEPYEQALRSLTELLAFHLTDGSKDYGHLGFDYIISGWKESVLREAIFSNNQLSQYKHEPTTVAIAECNPRFTSLSLSVLPLVRYIKTHSTEKDQQTTMKDILQMYGHNIDGKAGGFAVWDYVTLPSGIRGGTDLVNWITHFNTVFQPFGIFMVPRIVVENIGRDSYQSSVVLGLRPTNNLEHQNMFRDIVETVTRTNSLRDIANYINEV